MSQSLRNKIEANDTSINKMLKDQKFTIDYFQREYRWQERHIKLLVEDLTSTFLKSYTPGDERPAVVGYQSYYLGSVIYSVHTDTGKKSIIDGQQRITSITLLLIYLNHLQKCSEAKVNISDLIFSEKYGKKSFNMSDEYREECLKALFETGDYEVQDNDDETVRTMTERYEDIAEAFPEEIDATALPYFIDWLTDKVVIVEINAYSDENAYTIFETMNDRGLNLTPTEMLKGYVLSKITDKQKRIEINDLWRTAIQNLHEQGETADQSFFQAWFRSKYAKSMRSGEAGAENQDFELIGTRFHSWFKDNHKTLFGLATSDDFYALFKKQFPFWVKLYIDSRKYQSVYTPEAPHLHFMKHWGIAESLQDPLLLAAVKYGDDAATVKKKLDLVARYIETFTVRRSINNRKFGQTAIRYTMFNVIKQIRDNEVAMLGINLRNEVEKISESWSGAKTFKLNQMNRKFVKHLLSRITNYVDTLVGKDTTYGTYHHPSGKQFEIEHIWSSKKEEQEEDFEPMEFWDLRDSIGALLLLPRGTNQSFGSDKYEEKLEHYIKENTYVQTLHPKFYTKNPNFLKSELVQQLGFEPHKQFKKADILKRQEVVRKICEQLWSAEYFTLSTEAL